ncbi:SMP-30/gluconolactonase/LRE family protein [Mucilaginibacter sp.]|uniref:SMP-30/gluconolactonase/LRE family protein n=1 Tax=Mucilaginibacter sp. TaxID=1882438 RepID=UPI0032676889
MNASLLLNFNAVLGEGAIWDYDNQKLYWVDIEGRLFNVYDPLTQKNSVYNVHKRIGTVVPCANNKVLVALQDGIATLDLLTGEIEYKLNTGIHQENKRFNDGKCDPQGRFWVGSLTVGNATSDNKLYSLTSDFKLAEHLTGLTISNGIAWSADSSLMYHIDTPTGEVSQYDFDKSTGSIANKRVIIKIPSTEGYPDGMTIDSEGMLWIALWDGFGVGRYDPQTGKQLQKVNVPAPKVTSCAFGGKNLNQLYITTASCEMSEDELNEYPLSGSLFVVETTVVGCRSHRFNF